MKFLKKWTINTLLAAWILILVWFLVSWADVLLHNDPVTGDKQYMPGNVFMMITGLAE